MAIYKTTITDCKNVAENTVEISLKRPDNFSFKAGQYIQLGIPKLLYSDVKGTSRVFSISSSPLDQENISVTFRDTGSGFKRTLKELPVGTQIKVEGPYGFFTLPQNSNYPLVFVAGGIGITPYASMIRFATKNGFTFPVTLLYANKNKERAAYLKELEEIASCNKNFTFRSKFGRVDEKFIKESVQNARQCIWYIAGPPGMVDAVRNTLALLKVDHEQVHYEEFAGY